MANQLSVAHKQSILTLYSRGFSCRRIAHDLGLDRGTVRKYVLEAHGAGAGADGGIPKPATIAPTGSGGPLPDRGAPKPATIALTGSEGLSGTSEAASGTGEPPPGSVEAIEVTKPGTPSNCLAHRAEILAKLESGLTARRIHQDLASDHGGCVPSYHSVRRFVGKLRATGVASGGSGGSGGGGGLPFRRMECAPGQEMQVDFGRGAPVVGPDGKRRCPHVLRVVLSHSRKGYSQAVDRQDTESFIRCLEDAFHHFGGVPQTLVLDNLKAAVKRADWFDPEINPKVQSFCAHYGITALPTKPRTPRHKGKVERGVDYVQENGLKGRVFASLQEENRHLQEWEASIADTRIHGTTRKQVRELFERVEKPALLPLPPGERFPCFQEGQRTVHSDGHVEVDKAYYSVPPEHLGRRVWVRWESRVVRIFDARMNLIATHVRKEAGKFSTQDRHIVDQKISGVERGAAWLLQKVAVMGTQAQRWAEAMVQARGVEGVRVLQGLLGMGNKYPHAQIDRACGVALEHGAWRLRTISRLIGHDLAHVDQQQLFLDEHPIIRPMADYGRLVHDAFLQPTENP
ncbi:MAG: IS21 family transposase [Planctomycetota bacterium]|nr:IS21 family transposase [Planctomycetota bacterium]